LYPASKDKEELVKLATRTLLPAFLLATALLVSPRALQAQSTPCSSDDQQNALGAAYQNGFERGRADAQSMMPSYGEAGTSWTAEEARSAYSMGYGAGYLQGTSYPDRSASFMRKTAANDNQGASVDAARAGYEDGRAAGTGAHDRGNAYRPVDSMTYREADRGWTADSGDKDQYQQAYRASYVRGYQEGYGNSPTSY
jgi:hypothetical protein